MNQPTKELSVQVVFTDDLRGKIEGLVWRAQKAYNSNPEDTYPISITEATDGIMTLLSKAIEEARKEERQSFIELVESFSESNHSDNEVEKNISRGVKLLKNYLLKELRK